MAKYIIFGAPVFLVIVGVFASNSMLFGAQKITKESIEEAQTITPENRARRIRILERLRNKIQEKLMIPTEEVNDRLRASFALFITEKDPLERAAEEFGLMVPEYILLKNNFRHIDHRAPVAPEGVGVQKSELKEEEKDLGRAACYKNLVGYLLEDAGRITTDEVQDIYHIRVITQTDLKLPDQCGYLALYNLRCFLSAFELPASNDKESGKQLRALWDRRFLNEKYDTWRRAIETSGLGVPVSTDLAFAQLDYLCDGDNKSVRGCDPELKKFVAQKQLILIPGIYLIGQPGYNEPFGLENTEKIQDALEKFKRQTYGCLAFVMGKVGHFYGLCAVKIEQRIYTFIVDSMNQKDLVTQEQERIGLIFTSLRDDKPRFPFNYFALLMPKLQAASHKFIENHGGYAWVYGCNTHNKSVDAGTGEASLRSASSLMDICLYKKFETIFKENMPIFINQKQDLKAWFNVEALQKPHSSLSHHTRARVDELKGKMVQVSKFFGEEKEEEKTPAREREDILSPEARKILAKIEAHKKCDAKAAKALFMTSLKDFTPGRPLLNRPIAERLGISLPEYRTLKQELQP